MSEGRDYKKIPLGGFRLTDKGLAAIGVVPSVPVPLLDVPALVDVERQDGA